jgi:hypothetical protein
MYLVLSTLPHLFSIIPVAKYYRTHTFGYVNTIALSTFFSVLYHLTGESNSLISFLDHLIAVWWFLYDLNMGYLYTDDPVFLKIFFVNILSGLINAQTPYDENYEVYHSYWHLLNAFKSFYISWLISKGI